MNFTDYFNKNNFNEVVHLFLSKPSHKFNRKGYIANLSWLKFSSSEVYQALKKEIINETYKAHYSQLKTVTIDKKRTLYQLYITDRIVETLLGNYLYFKLKDHFPDNLFSYQKGKTYNSAVKAYAIYIKNHSNKNIYSCKRDIKGYFKNINQDALISKLKNHIKDESNFFWDLIYSFIHIQYKDLGTDQYGELSSGVPTGISLSNVLANIFLFELDHTYNNKKDVFYSRYGDDILIATNDYNQIEKEIEHSSKIIKKNQLEFKESKTKKVVFLSNPKESGLNGDYCNTSSIDYLGFQIDRDGNIFISVKREQRLKKVVRKTVKNALTRARKLKLVKEKQLEVCIKANNHALRDLLYSGKINDLIIYTDCVKKIKNLDFWLATNCTSQVFKKSGLTSLKHCSYKNCKKLGLYSLEDLRNCHIRRGTSFNVNNSI